ncbi:MAG: Tetratricopeptide repeat protein [Smithella sp. PtaU1.Bin162]|nr:MAG: Tetratricopeptide repeat protein [Smithella sp. PtaU1.Bin162]
MVKRALIIVVSLMSIIFNATVFSQTTNNPVINEGIKQYQAENYEEAIEILTAARKTDSTSAMAAFVLGMAYKQINDLPNAEKNLHDAVDLTPPIKEAYVELIDVLYKQDKITDAKKYLVTAEQKDIIPSKIAFLKGLILLKEDNNKAAIAAFEKSKKLDPKFSQAADLQIAIAYMKDGLLTKAKESLNLSITQNPLSDMAGFARQYQDVIDSAIQSHRPLRLTITALGGYDTNIISRPKDDAVAAGLDDEKGTVLQSSVRLDFTPRIEGPWLFNASYTAASVLNSKHTHSHDSLANSISMSPGYNFGRAALNFNMSYTNYLLRTDPDVSPAVDSSPNYRKYMDYYTFGPALRFLANGTNVIELGIGMEKKDYDSQKFTGQNNIRNAIGPKAYLSWIWLYMPNGFFNLRAEYNEEHTDGINWENKGNRLTANLSIPLLSEEKAATFGLLSLQLTGGIYIQNYLYDQTYQETDGSSVTDKRKDITYSGSIGLNWAFWKHASLICQYSTTGAYSNIPVNKYGRDLYMAGLEFRY